MSRQPGNRVSSRPAGDAGQVLVLVIVIMLALTVAVVAVIAFTGNAEREADRQSGKDGALSAAESGVANALSRLASAPRPLDPAALPPAGSPQVDAVERGTVSWYGALSGDRWTITSTSSLANPTGGGAISETVSVQARVGSTVTDPAWRYAYADDSGACTTLSGSVQLVEPLYTRGSLCLADSALVAGSPLQVGGTIETNGTASVGTAGTPIAELHVAGGCRAGSSGPFVSPCTPAEAVFASIQDAAPTAVSKPPLDLDFWYANARPGPSHSCTLGTFPGGFDTDGSLNRSRAPVDLFPDTSYDCTVVSGGSQVGRIAWTDGTPGTFVIDGAVFFDGDIATNSAKQVLYSGRGTVYASGTVALAGSVQVCGAWAGGCNLAGWAPATSMLVLVAGADGSSPGFSVSGSAQFQGGAYAATDFAQTDSAVVQGPKIADALTLATAATTPFAPFTFLPIGAPMEKPVVVTAGWRG